MALLLDGINENVQRECITRMYNGLYHENIYIDGYLIDGR